MKKQPKVTGWFPAGTKPIHVGHYQAREGSQTLWYWDGKAWHSPRDCGFNFRCSKQDWSWRGLTKAAA